MRKILLLALLAMPLLSVGLGDNASAFNNAFPDLADTEGGANVLLVNTKNTYVQQSDSKIRFWFPSNSGTITVHNGHFCNSNAYDYMETGTWSQYGDETNITRYRVVRSGATIYSGDAAPSGDEDRYGKKTPGTNGANCGNDLGFTITNIPATNMENGYYWVDFYAYFVAPSWGGFNYFRLTASANARIGIPDGSNGHSTTQEQVDTTPAYTTYTAPFGAPCDLASAEWATVSLYDMDNAGGSGAQPAGTDVKIRVRDYRVLSDPNDDVYVNWEGPTGTTWVPQGDNILTTKRFWAQPGHKYRLELIDVYYNNTIQYSLPYSQIFRLNCSWSLDGWARIDGLTGTVNSRRGVAHTFSFGVNRTGSSTADIRIAERWLSGNSGLPYDNPNYDFGPNWSDNHPFTVPVNAVPGTNYCMDVWYSEIAWNNAANGTSNDVCLHVIEAVVSAGIRQTPDEPPASPGYVEVGGTVTSTATVTNSGNATGNLNYLHQMWYEVGGITGPADRAYDAGTDLNLQQVGWTAIDVAPGSQDVHTFTQSVSAPPAGATHVCSRMQIQRRAGDTSIIDPPAATPNVVKCTPIGKAPSFAVTAGDVRTGGSYGSSVCSVNKPASMTDATNPAHNARLDHYFGVIAHDYAGIDAVNTHHSYVRDGVISLGNIENIVSKKAAIGNGADTTLHFARGPGATAPANTVLGGGRFYGEFTHMPNTIETHCLSPLFDANRYPASTQTPAVTAIGAGVTTVNLPNATLPPAPVPPATTSDVTAITAVTYNLCGAVADNLLVLNGPGGGDLVLSPKQQYIVRITQLGAGCNTFPVHVRINKNIRYTGTAASAGHLPQFVFLAGSNASSRIHIQVDNSVARLDGIYANMGASRFLTCAQRADDPGRAASRDIATADCSNSLMINGAVVLGGRLEVYRTGGHDNLTNTDPAETFNLRPDILLGDFTRDRSGSQLEIVNRRELAPRF